MFIMRPVPWLIHGVQYYDIVTPYGYGGPMILETNNGEKLKKEYSEAFGKYCSDHKIVSEFIRFHPIFQNYLDVDDSYDVIFPDIQSELIWKVTMILSKKNSLKACAEITDALWRKV